MMLNRPKQMLLPLFTEPCYVCWSRISEELGPTLYLPLPRLEGDGLCASHRARLQEGACLFCGRRVAWLRMASQPELAICRPCFVSRLGETAAQVVQAMQEDDGIGLIVS